MDTLFSVVPGFDQPIAVLKHCHDRIRKQLATLKKLIPHLEQFGANPEAQQAALSVLKYFQNAAHLHHEDEEIDLFPVLAKTATGTDSEILGNIVPTILEQHVEMARLWSILEKQLLKIGRGEQINFRSEQVEQFGKLYQEHMTIEETQIAPMAERILSEEQMKSLGRAMQKRRGIANSN